MRQSLQAANTYLAVYEHLKHPANPIGLARLKEAEGGQAVRLLEESKIVAHDALPLAAAYNKAPASTPAADHAEFDNDLRICVDSAFTKVTSKNLHAG